MLGKKQINKKEIFKFGILGGIAELVYILVIALVMTNLTNFGSNFPPYLGIILVLTIFVFSAAISGFFVLGYPAFLGLQKKYREAIFTLMVTLATILVVLIAIFLIIFIKL